MKRLLAIMMCLALLLPQNTMAAKITGMLHSFQTNKVITIAGPIDPAMEASVKIQMAATANLPGPRLVLIFSPGGYVDSGYRIIELLKRESQATHQKLVCAVVGAAHSMAFNILTQCDVRLATSQSTMVVHRVAMGGDAPVRMTARNLRILAHGMDKIDEVNDAINAKAMHLSMEEYGRNADAERRWTAQELLDMHYLTAIVTIGS
jgi:ATP-dependent protease ClpP protease subunit